MDKPLHFHDVWNEFVYTHIYGVLHDDRRNRTFRQLSNKPHNLIESVKKNVYSYQIAP